MRDLRTIPSLLCARPSCGRRGSALLIALAFVFLLTVLVVGFLSRTLTEQRISASSANQVNADLFAQGAEASIIGALEQEIQSPANSNHANNYIYIPLTPANMVPKLEIGGASTSATTANLLKISTSSPAANSTFPTATTALTSTASLNYRSVTVGTAGTPGIWTESEMIDPGAYSSFPVPNWIMVARNGSNPTTFSNTGANDVTFKPSGKSNSTTVVGRYAYAIYNEGGLLDMNVAGCPTTVSSGAPPATITSQSSYRTGEATADLTQLTSGGAQLLSNKQIDTLIGWRNNASVSPPAPTGTMSAPANLTTANATNYFSFILGNMNGFLSTSATSVAQSGSNYSTDQAFTSRSELIQFMQSLLGTSAASYALQYMTHFSRTLSQPSYIPAVNNPVVNGAPTTTAYSPTTSPGNGSNSANGKDTVINPSFLTMRVGAAFTRNDGSSANVGDPLVKKRFNLNRLAWITYKGPLCDGHLSGVAAQASDITSDSDLQIIANQLHTTYGLSWAFLQLGTAANIYNYFGLSWVADSRSSQPQGDGQKKWFYNHNNPNATGPFATLPNLPANGGLILSLGAVASRDPDFAELLLAGITAGSKAKTATLAVGNTTPAPASMAITATFPDNVQNQRDTSLPFAIIQLFANIIDQYDLDGYPTRILYSDGTLTTKEFFGVENLPYFYRARGACLEQVAIGAGTVEGLCPPYPHATGNVSSPGVYTFLQLPEIWNPHDQNSPRCAINPSTGTFLTDSTGNPMFPTKFRLVADSIDPDDISTSTATIGNTYYLLGGIATDGANPNVAAGYGGTAKINPQSDPNPASVTPWPTGSNASGSLALQGMQVTPLEPFPVFAESSALTFTINEATTPAAKGFFREPTLLVKPNVPAGSNLAAGGNNNPLVQPTSASVPGTLLGSTYPAPLNLQTASLISGGALLGSDGKPYLGIYLGSGPGAWYCHTPATASWPTPPLPASPTSPYLYADVVTGWDTRVYNLSGATTKAHGEFQISSANVLTYRMQYYNTYDPSGAGWSSYDCKYGISGSRGNLNGVAGSPPSKYLTNALQYTCATDPRTSRFSLLHIADAFPAGYSSLATSAFGWLDTVAFTVLTSQRPDLSSGYWASPYDNQSSDSPDGMPQAYGWVTSGEGYTANVAPMGLTAQNDPDFYPNGVVAVTKIPATAAITASHAAGATTPQYYADPDGVVRRGMAAFFSGAGSVGQPLAVANTSASGVETESGTQSQSRPIVLNRPFKSVAELGYTFSGTPWKNIDFFTPESGDSALLDLFTVNDTTDTNGLIAGKVDLNTQQQPVLAAIVSGAYKDEQKNYATPPGGALAALTSGASGEATKVAAALTTRTAVTNTATGMGPLTNVGDLVGKYVSKTALGGGFFDGSKSYNGFSADLSNGIFADASSAAIQRFRESAIRALSASGQTRVWNLMIDVVAQTGRYPGTATSFDQFTVEGEQHYWIHLAIDRLTGQVIDKQVEVIKE